MVDGINIYYGSSITQNVYKMFVTGSERGIADKHYWVSKSFTFNEPARTKNFNKIYVEGYIGEGTKIKLTAIYGINGSGGEKSQIIDQDSVGVESQKISAIGTDSFGTVSLGASSEDISDSYAFSIPINFGKKRSTRYKIRIESYYDDETVEDPYWAISNIAVNPSLHGIEQNKVLNSNK